MFTPLGVVGPSSGPTVSNEQDEPTSTTLNSDLTGFIRFEIVDGKPTLVDDKVYDKEKMIQSVVKILDKWKFNTPLERQDFLMKACKAFGIPSTVAARVKPDDFGSIASETTTILDRAQKADELADRANSVITTQTHDEFVQSLENHENEDDDESDDSE